MDSMMNAFTEGELLDGRYEYIALLNHGSFGVVYLASDNQTGEEVAIKCSSKDKSKVDDAFVELGFHQTLGSHANIVNLIRAFETEEHTYLVLEYCPKGDLYEAIRSNRSPLETEHVREFMLQLVSAVEHMHSKGIYHRDIKPENIFLSEKGHAKLGDFGLATTDKYSQDTLVGSDRYMSPEQYDSNRGGYEPAKADIWALGICLLNILFARNPFVKPDEEDKLFEDFSRDAMALFDIFPTMSMDTYNVLSHSLTGADNRSLQGMRDAINQVVFWTTDDESLDDFNAEPTEVNAVVGAREPLRTPSISTAINNGDSFPWAEALRASPNLRQLSVIRDDVTEDLFSDIGNESIGNDLVSIDDSSFFSESLCSSFDMPAFKAFDPKPTTLKVKTKSPLKEKANNGQATALVSPFLMPDKSFVSKSWDDWVAEDEEEDLRLEKVKTEVRRPCTIGALYKDDGMDENCYLSDTASERNVTFDDDDVEWIGGGRFDDFAY